MKPTMFFVNDPETSERIQNLLFKNDIIWQDKTKTPLYLESSLAIFIHKNRMTCASTNDPLDIFIDRKNQYRQISVTELEKELNAT